jgi:hypothetical protein
MGQKKGEGAGSLHITGPERKGPKLGVIICHYTMLALSNDNDFDRCRTTFLLTVYTRS